MDWKLLGVNIQDPLYKQMRGMLMSREQSKSIVDYIDFSLSTRFLKAKLPIVWLLEALYVIVCE